MNVKLVHSYFFFNNNFLTNLVIHEVKQNKRCSYPIYIKNGFLTLYNVTIWEDQTYTGRIVYECNYGYETMHGSDQIISDCVNGTWTNINDCYGNYDNYRKLI